MPRIATQSKEVDSRKFDGQKRVEKTRQAVDMALEANKIELEDLQQVTCMPSMDEATALAFNEDVLTILIHPTAEKNPEDPVYVSVNGRGGFIVRNQKTRLARKYVDRLLRAQADSVQQDTTATNEKDFNRLTVVPTQRYPLSVLHDPSPHGANWLQQITLGT